MTDGTGFEGPALLWMTALAVIALAGCGGSSSSSATQTVTTTSAATTAGAETDAALSHEEFVAKLDDICRRGNAGTARLQEQETQAVNAGDYAKAADVLEQAHREAEPLKAEIADLTPPAADAAAFARYKAAAARLEGLTARVVDALRANDLTEVTRLGGLATAERNKRTAAAIDLGLQHCGG